MENESVYDVNIAVLGHHSVGKTTLIQSALDLEESDLQAAPTPSRIITVANSLCMVRMFELAIEEVYRGESEPLCWPERLAAIHVHGVITLYDVSSKASFKRVPEVLSESWIVSRESFRTLTLGFARCRQYHVTAVCPGCY